MAAAKRKTKKRPLRIHVITDLEGAAMVFRFDQTRVAEPTPAKLEAMRLLTAEVNACVDGILDFDPGADVVVWDGHGSGGIVYESFHRQARLLPHLHTPAPYGLDGTFDALFFVGQHAMAGTPDAPLAHTYSSRTVEHYRLNGEPIGRVRDAGLHGRDAVRRPGGLPLRGRQGGGRGPGPGARPGGRGHEGGHRAAVGPLPRVPGGRAT